jgi:hypothetical protein
MSPPEEIVCRLNDRSIDVPEFHPKFTPDLRSVARERSAEVGFDERPRAWWLKSSELLDQQSTDARCEFDLWQLLVVEAIVA